MGPNTVAVIAAAVEPVKTNDPTVNRQLEWFREFLDGILGGDDERARLASEAGIG